MGFATEKKAGDEMVEIKRLFTPEFRNRLDAIVSFKALDHDDHPACRRQVPHGTRDATARKEKVDAIFTDMLKEHLAKEWLLIP